MFYFVSGEYRCYEDFKIYSFFDLKKNIRKPTWVTIYIHFKKLSIIL